jgi:hypothetical protein
MMSEPKARDLEPWIPRDLFAAYCGPRADKLLAYYDKANGKRQMITPQLDWFALLLLPAWLGYRRQWALWATLTGCLAAASSIEVALRFQLPNGAFGGLMLALGLMAHGLLLSNAHRLYLKAKKEGLSDEAIRGVLSNQAAPSAGFACLALFGSLALGLLFALISPSNYAPDLR